MLRSVIAILVLGIAFFGSSCDSIKEAMSKSAIEKALHEDALTGKQPTAEHVAAMRNVDMANCPPDFREAYMNHVHAWERAAAVNDARLKLKNDESTAAAAGAIASLFDSDATPWSDHLRAEQEAKRLGELASAQIASTWRDLETVASRYGAKAPQ